MILFNWEYLSACADSFKEAENIFRSFMSVNEVICLKQNNNAAGKTGIWKSCKTIKEAEEFFKFEK